ncbi:hypothetical protein [Vibrio neptunius]|uniref:hypothetical protein n=1 Tax=Vibrio neptunius TaxID=170651 RepID=UPI001C5CA665|nr:hypothetical protein [Vibrio neptunius]QXX09030.1 hypothetical protein KW548_18205 [Vibrio neptunius]
MARLGGTSPFGAALPVAHGVELQGGSFKQGFISGVIGKLGGGIVHANVQTQVLQAGGMVIVSGIAAAASGANSRDAVMRSAVSVITVYLFNELGKTQGDHNFTWAVNKERKRLRSLGWKGYSNEMKMFGYDGESRTEANLSQLDLDKKLEGLAIEGLVNKISQTDPTQYGLEGAVGAWGAISGRVGIFSTFLSFIGIRDWAEPMIYEPTLTFDYDCQGITCEVMGYE